MLGISPLQCTIITMTRSRICSESMLGLHSAFVQSAVIEQDELHKHIIIHRRGEKEREGEMNAVSV